VITIELEPGESLLIGGDIVVSLLKPHVWKGKPDGRAHLGVACPREYGIGREGRRSRLPVLERLPGVTRRPGPPVQRRAAKGGGA
jgi:hypothetical protein